RSPSCFLPAQSIHQPAPTPSSWSLLTQGSPHFGIPCLWVCWLSRQWPSYGAACCQVWLVTRSLGLSVRRQRCCGEAGVSRLQAPTPSIERTSTSGLRPLAAAAHVER